MKTSSEPTTPDIDEKIDFLDRSTERLKALEVERTDIHEEIRAAFKVVFAFRHDPVVLTADWMKRIEEVLDYYENPLSDSEKTEKVFEHQPEMAA